jgi:hypothetical protein
MNNLDSRCPNVVNVEIHFNNFMGDIFDGWKNGQDNADEIDDYEFTEEAFSVAFHKILNDIYGYYLNKIIRNPSAFEDLTIELWENFNDEFEKEIEYKRITIWLEGEK